VRLKPFIIPVFIPHAGCPHRCIFCNQNTTTSQEKALPSDADIHQAITRFLAYRRTKDQPVEISFYGGNFLGLPAQHITRLLDLSNGYVQNGVAGGIRFSTRPDTIDAERLELIRPYPVRTIELGVQSMNDDVLGLCRRGHTTQDTCRAVAMLCDQSYRLGLQMMVGLPGDSADSALETARRMAEMAPDFVRIYPTLVLRGSALSDWYAKGRYAPMDLAAAVSLTSRLYRIFELQGIRVIRMGLQPTEELNSQVAVVAGPFHPAFGELVLSELWMDAIARCCNEQGLAGGTVLLQVHPRHLSSLKGQKSNNIRHLQVTFNLAGIEVHTDSTMPLGTVRVNGKSCSLL
jgi:histone acetyltransferase (RNA polymerase elongator complex component)